MKIYFENPNSARTVAKVWHNDVEHDIRRGDKLNLPVKMGDTVKYKVGAMSATHKINFQSPDSIFTIMLDRKAQFWGIGAFFAIIAVMYFAGLFDNQIVGSVGALVAVALFEVVVYFRGWKTTVVHR
ncbi:hypothetical protein PQ472_04475 [Lacticaseibacillus pabuli]|uniref:Uncharacterized protein n=1 Tax=Lacticaseibacillus pabuli TaxID=3025672 RepID=A0ABY7WX16_9LACO|nr:hypothetical protein [Lacticaseibacillus sp. KACC 23028]WDF83497.1 hypothetical protein PQ472_04475 [Lacticaseibacillus sp. KACC 23028]